METTDWEQRAACRDAGDLFYPQMRTVEPRKERTPTNAHLTLVRGSHHRRCSGCVATVRASDPSIMCDSHPDPERLEQLGEAAARQGYPLLRTVEPGQERTPTNAHLTLVRGRRCAGCVATVRASDPSIMCDSHPDPERLERLGEATARQVCAVCPVRAECLADVQRDNHQPVGVFGGLNRWERMWLQAADPDQKQELHDLAKSLTPQQCIELREAFIETGPQRRNMRGAMPNEIAVRYGVPSGVAARWVEQTGASAPHKGRTPQTEAILRVLGEGEWIEKSVVQSAAEQAVPTERAMATAADQGVSEARAREMIAFRCIDDRKTCRSIVERDIDGVAHMRLVPRLPGKARAKAPQGAPVTA